MQTRGGKGRFVGAHVGSIFLSSNGMRASFDFAGSLQISVTRLDGRRVHKGHGFIPRGPLAQRRFNINFIALEQVDSNRDAALVNHLAEGAVRINA